MDDCLSHLLLLDITPYVTFNWSALTPGVIFCGLLACFLLFVSGYASGSEISFFSLTPNDINEMEERNDVSDRIISSLRNDNERTLATILITNNFVNVTIIMLCNYFFNSVMVFSSSWLHFLCITVLLTFLLLLFGEIMPKVYCSQHALMFCRFACRGLTVLRKLFYPLATVLMSTGTIARRVVTKDNRVLSVDDLEQALELTDTDEIKDEKNILQGIVRFGDETAKEVMTSRQDVVDIDYKATFPEVLRCIVENNYSRIPVYQDNNDNIRGILYIKDLLPHLGKPSNFRWQSLIRPPYFVPETKKIDDLMREFQKDKVHIAIVVDEFGGTSGIITLEDILEEIVGEINDEFDEEEKNYIQVNRNTYIFLGKMLLSDFYKVLDIPEDTFDDVVGEADTLAGLLLEIKGDFPKLHEKFEHGAFLFEIVGIDGHRISKIKVVVKNT